MVLAKKHAHTLFQKVLSSFLNVYRNEEDEKILQEHVELVFNCSRNHHFIIGRNETLLARMH